MTCRLTVGPDAPALEHTNQQLLVLAQQLALTDERIDNPFAVAATRS